MVILFGFFLEILLFQIFFHSSEQQVTIHTAIDNVDNYFTVVYASTSGHRRRLLWDEILLALKRFIQSSSFDL